MPTNFDDYADRYTDLHASSIRASGESPRYFADYKVECLVRLGVALDGPLLDFGSGVGNLTEALVERFAHVHAYDPSRASVEIARKRLPNATHHERLETVPAGYFETAVLSGVLHHIAPGQRRSVLEQVRSRLRAGGRIFVFEHNPLNPVTRRAVDKCPYDDDAILLYPWEVKRALRGAGYERVALDYIVFFPRRLRALRPLEPKLRRCVLGAQTMTIGQRGPGGED